MRILTSPERVYSQAELQTYLQHCRQKCQATLASLTAAQAQRPCLFGWGNQLTFAELLSDRLTRPLLLRALGGTGENYDL